MTKAQYSVPPINRSLVRSIIKKELGNYPEKVFKSFNSEAVAAASIGQVHRATLMDGTEVAVKVQYPGVRETISSDIAIAKSILKRIVSNVNALNEYIDEVRSTLLDETDYLKEGTSMETFHNRFASEQVVTPRWIEELSTERVLTMTYLEGKHLKEFLESNPSETERNRYGQLMWDFFHTQIESVMDGHFEFHADTHPGNFLYTPDGKLGVIDYGCVKTFPKDFFYNYLLLLPTHINRDEVAIVELYNKLGVIAGDPNENKKEKRFYDFALNYGFAFALPYLENTFDFGDPEYRELIRQYTKNTPITNEPRGNKHFIYSTRVHLGLYHLLMKLGATVQTIKSREAVERTLEGYEERSA
ncbi:ABC1 kinase family protein [Rhodohalobacter halophilus]|uniref:ABC1 kinase family protein n=1 Tax=Rhodohalobacter halophilus TaxID=1812810 RepID=UPI001FDF859E|nr:AarF/ABC1/UbiB kinase family protein [Rhodohalobacter halophilus]